MAIDPHSLPNDPAALRQMVMSLLEEVETKDRRLRQLQHWVEQLLRARYGPRRERVNENQLFLFAVALVSAGREAPREPAASAAHGESSRGRRGKAKGHGRRRAAEIVAAANGWSTIWRKANGSVRNARKRFEADRGRGQ